MIDIFKNVNIEKNIFIIFYLLNVNYWNHTKGNVQYPIRNNNMM